MKMTHPMLSNMEVSERNYTFPGPVEAPPDPSFAPTLPEPEPAPAPEPESSGG